MARRNRSWLSVGWNAWSLGIEASSVIGLRLAKIAAGGEAGEREARRMVAEKIDAGLELQALALTGGLGWSPSTGAARTIAHYRRKVRANRQRLSRA